MGIEEELLLVDPETRGISSRAHEVLKEFRERGAGRGAGARPATDELDQELFRHQLETRTDPTTDLGDARAQVVSARRTAGQAARATGLALVAAGVVPAGDYEPDVSRLQGWYDRHYRGHEYLVFRGMRDHYRRYAWS